MPWLLLLLVGAGAALALSRGGISLPSAPTEGSQSSTQTYKGTQFDVAYFSDWYNGTGWRFRFHDGAGWRGVFDSKAQAIGSAQMMIDGG